MCVWCGLWYVYVHVCISVRERGRERERKGKGGRFVMCVYCMHVCLCYVCGVVWFVCGYAVCVHLCVVCVCFYVCMHMHGSVDSGVYSSDK